MRFQINSFIFNIFLLYVYILSVNFYRKVTCNDVLREKSGDLREGYKNM